MVLRVLLAALLALACERLEPAARPGAAARRSEPAAAQPLEGEVVAVHDGDTLSLRSGGQTIRVRLAQIDAPERGQPWGRRAQQALARLAERRSARLVPVDLDDYGRTVGDLFVGDVFVNEALVREGHAWAHPRYVRSAEVIAAEAEARRAGRGLWRLAPGEREPPWEWRRAHPRSGPRRSPGP